MTAYTIDFKKMTPEQIEETIKRINKISITDERAKYLGEDGYRNRNVGISGKNIGFTLLINELSEDDYKGEEYTYNEYLQ